MCTLRKASMENGRGDVGSGSGSGAAWMDGGGGDDGRGMGDGEIQNPRPGPKRDERRRGAQTRVAIGERAGPRGIGIGGQSLDATDNLWGPGGLGRMQSVAFSDRTVDGCVHFQLFLAAASAGNEAG